MTACEQCFRPGQMCALGGLAKETASCVVCGTPTRVRSACGAARTYWCDPDGTAVKPWAPGDAHPPVRVISAEARPVRPPGAERLRRSPAPVGPTLLDIDRTRVDALEELWLGDRLKKDFIPRRSGRAPYWSPPLPPVMFDVAPFVVSGSWSWSRPHSGATVVLDRSGAWLAAASSADFAHGVLEHTGPIDWTGRPGLYLVDVYPWAEADRIPHPLAGADVGTQVWVTHARMKLLADLATAGRWPAAAAVDSWTADGSVRLNDWAGHVNALRAHAIQAHGRDSDQYDHVKKCLSMALNTMQGSPGGALGRVWKSDVRRPDWRYTVSDQSAVTLWRWADDCRQVVALFERVPGALGPLTLQHVDELVLPADALPIVTTVNRPGNRAPLQLDPAGLKLGTFKVKAAA